MNHIINIATALIVAIGCFMAGTVYSTGEPYGKCGRMPFNVAGYHEAR